MGPVQEAATAAIDEKRQRKLEYLREWRRKKLEQDPDYERRHILKWHAEHPEAAKEYSRRRRAADPIGQREYHRQYCAENRERIREIQRGVNKRRSAKVREYLKSPEQAPKQAARFALNTAVRAGRIVKPTTCEQCKAETPSRRLHGHHTDYSKAYDVRWLCASCHSREHHAA